jgi:hypothetical protein
MTRTSKRAEAVREAWHKERMSAGSLGCQLMSASGRVYGHDISSNTMSNWYTY